MADDEIALTLTPQGFHNVNVSWVLGFRACICRGRHHPERVWCSTSWRIFAGGVSIQPLLMSAQADVCVPLWLRASRV